MIGLYEKRKEVLENRYIELEKDLHSIQRKIDRLEDQKAILISKQSGVKAAIGVVGGNTKKL